VGETVGETQEHQHSGPSDIPLQVLVGYAVAMHSAQIFEFNLAALALTFQGAQEPPPGATWDENVRKLLDEWVLPSR
jgi:hypothetical protein